MSSAPDRGLLAAHDPASDLDHERPVGEAMAAGGIQTSGRGPALGADPALGEQPTTVRGPTGGRHRDRPEDPRLDTPAPGGAQHVDRDDDWDRDGDRERDSDWAWVEEWRLSGEPVPWGPGLAVAAFCALVVGIAVWVLTAGLADMPLLSLGANVLVALGLAPALWLSRSLPVLRWIAGGGAAGVVIAWLAALVVLT